MMLILLEVIYPALMVFCMMLVFMVVMVLIRRVHKLEDKLIDRHIAMSQIDYELQTIKRDIKDLSNVFSTMSSKAESNIHYQYANRILSSGGNVDEIMDSCDMSRGEAELISAIQGSKK